MIIRQQAPCTSPPLERPASLQAIPALPFLCLLTLRFHASLNTMDSTHLLETATYNPYANLRLVMHTPVISRALPPELPTQTCQPARLRDTARLV